MADIEAVTLSVVEGWLRQSLYKARRSAQPDTIEGVMAIGYLLFTGAQASQKTISKELVIFQEKSSYMAALSYF